MATPKRRCRECSRDYEGPGWAAIFCSEECASEREARQERLAQQAAARGSSRLTELTPLYGMGPRAHD